jgi:hypothetical protein
VSREWIIQQLDHMADDIDTLAAKNNGDMFVCV